MVNCMYRNEITVFSGIFWNIAPAQAISLKYMPELRRERR